MSILSVIKGAFASPKIVDTGLELAKKGASGIDMLFYTNEEKEIARKEWFAMVLKSENANQEQAQIRNVTRRTIAQQFIKVYLFLILVEVVLYKLDPAWAKHIFEMLKVVSYCVVPIVVFFFGSYGWGTYVKKDK